MYHQQTVLKYQRRLKLVVSLYKEEIGCLNPGCEWTGKYHAEMLEFHHLDPMSKEYSPAALRIHLKKFASEITKCTLLCANCHRLITHNKTICQLNPCPQFDYKKYIAAVPKPLKERSYRYVRNRKRSNKFLSIYPGVTFHKRSQKWQVLVRGRYLGLFATEEEAAKIAREYFDKT